MQVAAPDKDKLDAIANRIRIRIVKAIGKAGSGHAGGALSLAEILSVLYFHEMRTDPKNPKWEDRDRFILSKGHGCLALYAALVEAGYFAEDVLWTAFKIASPLQAHPEMICPGVEMSTGALGQGLSAGIGMALGARMRGKDFRVYVALGDGESAEGQVWEAIMCAPKYRLDNLVAILDYNKLALSGRTSEVMPVEPLRDRLTSFGWHVIEADGHSVVELAAALREARETRGKPSYIVAHTVKGRGISYLQDKVESHAIVMSREEALKSLRELGCSEEEIGAVWA